MIQRYLRSESAQTHSNQGAPYQARFQIPAATKHPTTVPRFGSAAPFRFPTTLHQPEDDSHLRACGGNYRAVFTIRFSHWFHGHGSFIEFAHTSTHDFTMAPTAWCATTSTAAPSTTRSRPMQQAASGRVRLVTHSYTNDHTHTRIHASVQGSKARAQAQVMAVPGFTQHARL